MACKNAVFGMSDDSPACTCWHMYAPIAFDNISAKCIHAVYTDNDLRPAKCIGAFVCDIYWEVPDKMLIWTCGRQQSRLKQRKACIANQAVVAVSVWLTECQEGMSCASQFAYLLPALPPG